MPKKEGDGAMSIGVLGSQTVDCKLVEELRHYHVSVVRASGLVPMCVVS